jgi:hypothetical protein
MTAWARWRSDAAKGMGALGGTAEKTFLEEQAKITKERFVRKACEKAAAAIEKRLDSRSYLPRSK